MAQTIVPVTFCQIININSRKSLRPQNPGSSGSALVQDDPGPFVSPEFSWGFILDGTKNGQNLYRIFNAFSGLSIDARGNSNPPTNGEVVQQHTWIAGQQNQVWLFDGFLFLSAYDQNYCWEVKDNSTNSGAVIEMHTISKGARNQEWELKLIEATQLAASAGKTT